MLDKLPRLPIEALGPCIGCSRLMLVTGPVFIRVKFKRCGIDASEVRRHAGFAQSIAPGRDGLVLAEILGPRCEPVVVFDDYDEVNVCIDCVDKSVNLILLGVMAKAEQEGKKP